MRDAIAKLQTAHPGRFIVFTEPAWTKASDDGYSKTQADLIEDAHKAGAKGLKVLKTLGLFLREREQPETGPNRRSAFRPHVGGRGVSEDAGGDPYFRSGSLLPADRPIQRALRGTARSPGLVLPRKGLSRAIANCRRRGAMSCGAIRRRSSSACTLPMPKIFRTFRNAWTATRICSWISQPESES